MPKPNSTTGSIIVVLLLLVTMKTHAELNIPEEFIHARNSLVKKMQTSHSTDKLKLAFQLGQWEDSDPGETEVKFRSLDRWNKLKKYNFSALREWSDSLLSADMKAIRDLDQTSRYVFYKYLSLRKDYRSISELLNTIPKSEYGIAEFLASGSQCFRNFSYDDAAEQYRIVLKESDDPLMRSVAYLGISKVLQRRKNWDGALDTLLCALREGGFSDNLVHETATVLIRLGRINETIELLHLAVEINPNNMDAHYFLGNGYARMNYTELKEKYSGCFPDSGEKAQIDQAKQSFDELDYEEAFVKLETIRHQNTVILEIYAIQAEILWLNGELDSSADKCFEALKLCPDYGRAHSILARVFDMKMQLESIHFNSDNDIFDNTGMPVIEDIDKYVVNWGNISDRYRKRTALSVQPWAAFVPVLAATNNTHYIKPMHELLSECPYMETIADKRINLDSRLWDDVRGCGGQHTVTGVEDVENIIYHRYNTVLHELTHQVHFLLTDDDRKRIEKAFRKAKRQEAEGIPTFLTRYQASNEWEYFAEGVNSYYSPQRDEFDPGELTRERLFKMDTTLVELVEYFTSLEDVTPYYIVGKVNAAEELLEYGKAVEVFAKLQEIAEQGEDSPTFLRTYSHVASILDKDLIAVSAAERMIELFPADAQGYISMANALLFTGRDWQKAAAVLLDSFNDVDPDFRYRLNMKLGEIYQKNGNYAEAIKHYENALSYQDDMPQALWGLACTWGEWREEKNASGKAYEYFRQLERIWSGVVELRLDFARIAILNSDFKTAEIQIGEAENLQPHRSIIKINKALFHIYKGDSASAKDLLNEIAEDDFKPDLYRILQAFFTGKKELENLVAELSSTPPRYTFNPEISGYVPVGEFPFWQRQLCEDLINRLN